MHTYNIQINNLKQEIEQLKSLSHKDIIKRGENFNRLITARIEKLNAMIAMAITKHDKYGDPFWKWIKEIDNNKAEFLNETLSAFSISHPHFINFLKEHGLTDDEMRCVCLYAIGLNGKEAGNYLDQKSHYMIMATIRKKLNIDSKINMTTFVRKLLKES